MKKYFQTTILFLCTLFSFGLQAQENALPDGLMQLQNIIDANADGLTKGFTMPMRITGSQGNTSVDIGIDTFRYVRNGNNEGKVTFSAHVDLQIPFAIEDGKESTKIKFWGENLILAGEGGSSRLHLEVGLPPITLQKDKIWLRLGKDSYVDFTCDGIEAIGLSGDFIFAPNFLIPASGNPADTVKAHFDVKIADWDDLMMGVTFNRPFKISGGGDFIFAVDGVVVDFSTQSNVPGFTFPVGYETGFTEKDVNLWTGFAIKKIEITPPQEIGKLGGGRPFTYSVSDMLIDEWGLTGAFLAARASLIASDNNNSGLNLSIDTIGVSIVQNRIHSGILGGSMDVPLLKDINTDKPLRLGISGQIQYDTAKGLLYRLSGAMLNSQTYGVPFTDKAKITLDTGCSFTVGTIGGGDFNAALLLNGSLNIESDLNIKGIKFEGLKLSTHSPHFDWKYFGLVGSAGVNFAGFSIHLTELGLLKEGEDKATLKIAAKIALIGDDMSIGAGAGFRILASYKPKENKWTFDKFTVDKIYINIDYSAFRFDGCIERFDDDFMYGDGFKGGITLEIKSLGFGVKADIYFGKTKYNRDDEKNPFSETFRYWFVQITADVSGLGIMLFPPAVMLKSITGGAYQHMSNSLVASLNGFNSKNPEKISVDNLTKTPAYIPDKKTAFGFVAGIGAYFAQKNLVSIEVLLEMAFNSHCGLRYVALKGLGTFLAEDIEKGMVKAAVFSYYDVENKIFSLNAAVKVDFVKVITGQGYIDIYKSPKTWHCYIGKHDDPNTLEFVDVAKVEAYFMAGAIPTQLPPLNNNIIRLFGAEGYSSAAGQNELMEVEGKGFAFGVSLSADCGFGQKKGFAFAYISLDGGTDALVDFTDKTCGKYDVKWRSKGRFYCYMDAAVGVRVRKKKIGKSLTAASKLEAEFPAPYYFEGRIEFKYKVLFIKGKVSCKFSKGKQC